MKRLLSLVLAGVMMCTMPVYAEESNVLETEALAEIIANAYGKMKCDEKYANKSQILEAIEKNKILSEHVIT